MYLEKNEWSTKFHCEKLTEKLKSYLRSSILHSTHFLQFESQREHYTHAYKNVQWKGVEPTLKKANENV